MSSSYDHSEEVDKVDDMISHMNQKSDKTHSRTNLPQHLTVQDLVPKRKQSAEDKLSKISGVSPILEEGISSGAVKAVNDPEGVIPHYTELIKKVSLMMSSIKVLVVGGGFSS